MRTKQGVGEGQSQMIYVSALILRTPEVAACELQGALALSCVPIALTATTIAGPVCHQSAHLPTRCKAPAHCVGKRQPFSAADDGELPPSVVWRSASHAREQRQLSLVGRTATAVSLALCCTTVCSTSNTQPARPRAITLSQSKERICLSLIHI